MRKRRLEWRRVQFHIFIRKGKRGAALSIREDAASSLPPFHTAKHRGKALDMEMAKIVDAHRKMRMPTR